jgi:hypothetical protein
MSSTSLLLALNALCASAHAADAVNADGLRTQLIHGVVPGQPVASLAAVPDPTGVELALATFHVPLDRARVVSAQEVDGNVVIVMTDLEDGKVRTLRTSRAGRVCTPATPNLLWTGGQQIKVYAAAPGDLDRVRGTPALVLVDEDPNIGAVVSLAPGDRVLVRGTRRDGLLLRETVTVLRPSGSITVERDEERERFCYDPPEGPTE